MLQNKIAVPEKCDLQVISVQSQNRVFCCYLYNKRFLLCPTECPNPQLLVVKMLCQYC